MSTYSDQPAGSARRQFGAVAKAYATSAVHASGRDLEALVQSARLTGTERVLDLGCGAGHVAAALAPRAGFVTAADVTPEMLEVASGLATQRGLTNIAFRQADATALPFEDQSFDLVTSRYSAHHFSDPARALAQVVRVLRPAGRFLLVDTVAPEAPALDTFFNAVELLRDASHVRNCRPSEWQRLFREAGLHPLLIFEMQLELAGEAWVTRMRTPSTRVAAVRELFQNATAAAREAFAICDGDGWGWSIPVALIEGRRGETGAGR